LHDRAKVIVPSARGELEITELNRSYLSDNSLRIEVLPDSTVWLDTGTIEGLSEASEFVRVVQARQGKVIGSPEEAARVMNFI
jgi:glucose-1-phosphate thymidylyltransferase